MKDHVMTVPRFWASEPIPMPRRTRRVRLNLPDAPLPPFHAWRA